MADFNHKKLQVFVSSTFTDLRNERQAAVEAILTAGHIPAGMELFAAGDESQMEVIKQWIDESDVYMLILGGRYGSIDTKSGKSYTHLEYDYALSKGKPLFACVINEKAREARVRTEGSSVIEQEYPQKLKEFRGEVLSRMSKFWENQKDIKIAVSETLSGIARRDDLRGWVRPSSQSDLPALADEIARLSKENAALRDRLSATSQEISINGLSFSELKAMLEAKNALEYLLNKGPELGSGSGMYVDGAAAGELQLRGIIHYLPNGRHGLTESGRVFYNKLTFSRLSPSG